MGQGGAPPCLAHDTPTWCHTSSQHLSTPRRNSVSMDEAPVEAGDGRSRSRANRGQPGQRRRTTRDGGVEEPPRQYVEIDDPDNRYVRVKVDGEDVEVPFSEVMKGYSREADYTRKAQAVAQQRQEAEYGISLQRALAGEPRDDAADPGRAARAQLRSARPAGTLPKRSRVHRSAGAGDRSRSGRLARRWKSGSRSGKRTSSWSGPSRGCDSSST